ncbi:hypothetical protein RFI_15556, partial [Reticulomyxa filosa]
LQSLPLLYACQYRDDLNENLLRWLIPKHLEHNPDFWLNRHPKSGNYLLHLAVQNSHPNCLERLHLLKKIIPDHFYKQLLVLTNKNHQTALMYACAISSEVLGEGIFEILLPQLLDKASLSFWEMRDTKGRTLIELALCNTKGDTIERLKTIKRNMPKKTYFSIITQKKPLIYVLYLQSEVRDELVQMLVPRSEKVDLNAYWEVKDKVLMFKGHSLLHLAILNQQPHFESRVKVLKKFAPKTCFDKMIKLKDKVTGICCFYSIFFFFFWSGNIFKRNGWIPLMYLFYFQHRIDDSIIELLLPDEIKANEDISFWELTDNVTYFLKNVFLFIYLFVCLLIFFFFFFLCVGCEQSKHSLLQFSIQNNKPHLEHRLELLKKWIPEQSFQKLIRTNDDVAFFFFFFCECRHSNNLEGNI